MSGRWTRWTAIPFSVALLLMEGGPLFAAEHDRHLQRLQCLACHAGPNRIVTDPETGETRSVTIRMRSFHQADHGEMECVDCHEKGFEQYPHVNMDTNVCMDCHPRRDKGAKDDEPYEFDRIDEEFRETVHFTEYQDKKAKCCGLAPRDHVVKVNADDDRDNQFFTCEHCHDPHYFVATERIALPQLILENDNGPCLDCHEADADGVLADPVKTSMAAAHAYLPHVDLHLEATRCIDCHTSVKTAVAHDLPEGRKADQGCNSCHSVDTVLAKRLYRYVERSNALGFQNAQVLQDTYVMGANRHRWADLAAFTLVGLLSLAIALHIGMRVYFRHREASSSGQHYRKNGGPR